MRTMSLAALALFTAGAACAQQPTPQGKEADPTRKVAGAGAPAGWSIRLDDKDTARYTVNDTKFVTMGPGLHVTSGPAALYHQGPVTGLASITATFNQVEAPRHPEGYGLFFGGRDLQDPSKQTYVYFLVRGDGQYYLAHRAGPDVHRIIPWTPSAAIVKQDSAGHASNAVTIRTDADSVRFLVNGKQVHAITRKEITTVDGVAGLRVNHNLNVHVAGYAVAKQ